MPSIEFITKQYRPSRLTNMPLLTSISRSIQDVPRIGLSSSKGMLKWRAIVVISPPIAMFPEEAFPTFVS